MKGPGAATRELLNHWQIILLLAFCVALLAPAVYGAAPSDESAPRESVNELGENAVSIELLGRGIAYSINYDHQFNQTFVLGAGIGFFPIPGAGSLLSIPFYLNAYVLNSSDRSARMFLTAGADATYASNSGLGTSAWFVFPVVGVGYEYRSPNGFLFRVAPYVSEIPSTTTAINADGSSGDSKITGYTVVPWLGITFGVAF